MKDIITDFFKIKSRPHRPVCGGLLIAEPFMKEAYFNHGVVSLIDYVPAEGATGVVLNNATEYLLPELLDGVNKSVKVPVFCGGPVGQDRLFFIHTLGPEIIANARQYAPGLYIGGEFSDVIAYVNEGYRVEGNIRFFIGYSSWCEGQLEREISRESWVQYPAPADTSELLRYSGDTCWHRAVLALGSAYRSWTLLPRNIESN